MTLNLNLTPQLLLHLVLLQFGFVQDFQRHNVAGAALAGQVDVAEFPYEWFP